MKGTKSKTSAQPKAAAKTGTQGGTSSGQRSQPAAGSKYHDHCKKTYTELLNIEGGSKETFLKKLQVCMKTYDYKDETKDVRGKVNPL
jgi:hypothetical protein